MKHCPSCGAVASADASFCGECGHSVALAPTVVDTTRTDQIDPDSAAVSSIGTEGSIQSHRRAWMLVSGVALLLIVASGVVFGVPQIRHNVFSSGRAHGPYRVKLASSSATLTACSTLLSTSDAAALVDAPSMQMEIGPHNTSRVSNPSANCEYNLNNGGPNGVPNLTKSFSLELWTNVPQAGVVYADFQANDMNIYEEAACDLTQVHGVGEKAVWSGGTGCDGSPIGMLLVQVNDANVILLWGLPEGAGITAANQIVGELGGIVHNPSGPKEATPSPTSTTTSQSSSPGSSSPQTGSSSQLGSASPTTTTTQSSSPSRSSPQGSSGPTPTSTPSAVAPTTTTTTAPLSGDEQKYVTDVENQFPGISPAIAAGSYSAQTLATEGEEVCTAFSLLQPSANLYGNPYEFIDGDLANETLPGPGNTVLQVTAVPSVSTYDNIYVVSFAVEDICPTYVSDIPAGDPGAQ